MTQVFGQLIELLQHLLLLDKAFEELEICLIELIVEDVETAELQFAHFVL